MTHMNVIMVAEMIAVGTSHKTCILYYMAKYINPSKAPQPLRIHNIVGVAQFRIPHANKISTSDDYCSRTAS